MRSFLLDQPRLSRKELAEKLGVSPISVDRYVRVGVRGHKLPRVKIGGRSYFLIRDVEWWLRATGDNLNQGHDANAEEEHDAALLELKALGI